MRRRWNWLKIIKIAVGVVCSVLAAEALGLNYATSAGIITLLSIQDTKKETLRIVARRMISFVVALFLFALVTKILGYSAVALGVFLLFFSPVCLQFGMSEGISTNTVLMCHFLAAGSIEPEQILNEWMLLLVGAGTGVLLNLYMPRQTEAIRRTQEQIEERMRWILKEMARRLDPSEEDMPLPQPERTTPLRAAQASESEDCGVLLSELRALLESGQRKAYENMENHLRADVRYYFRYMNMRQNQVLVLERIDEHIRNAGDRPDKEQRITDNRDHPAGGRRERNTADLQARRIAGLMLHISERFHEYNNAVELLDRLERVRAEMRDDALPADREEFEIRAVYYHILIELEQFLSLKKDFVRRLPKEDIEHFWKPALYDR